MKKRRVMMLVLVMAPPVILGVFNWVLEAIGIASLILGQSNANRAAKGAEGAAAAQLEFSKQLYEDYKKKYGPLEDQLLADLQIPVGESDAYRYGTAQIERGIGTADAALRRRFAGPVGTNLEGAYRSQNQLTRTGAGADLFANLNQARDTNRLNLLATGKGISGPGANLADVYNTRTNIAGQNAQAAGGGFADLAGNLSLLYMLGKGGGGGGGGGVVDDRLWQG